jgi:hypothetical protein
MSTYRITNITNTAGKRDSKFNSNLDIEYVDSMTRKTMTIKPGNCVYLTVSSLPLSVHRLRIKNLITVEEIGATELAKLMKQPQLKTKVKKETIENLKVIDDSSKKVQKKKAMKKEEVE